MNCAYCKHTDGVVYTSLPPKYKCTITGEYHVALDDCNVEFAPVKHGRWVRKTKEMENSTVYWHECSECGCRPPRQFTRDWETNFCPHCGARMDEMKDD